MKRPNQVAISEAAKRAADVAARWNAVEREAQRLMAERRDTKARILMNGNGSIHALIQNEHATIEIMDANVLVSVRDAGGEQ